MPIVKKGNWLPARCPGPGEDDRRKLLRRELDRRAAAEAAEAIK
jgi:hypothetical protein